jgi:hypothetical protein
MGKGEGNVRECMLSPSRGFFILSAVDFLFDCLSVSWNRTWNLRSKNGSPDLIPTSVPESGLDLPRNSSARVTN